MGQAMNRLMHRLLAMIVSMTLFSVYLSAEAITRHGKMGFLVDGINAARYKESRLAFTEWAKSLKGEDGVYLDVVYYESYAEIIEDYRAAKIDGLIINPIFYLKDQRRIDKNTQEYWMIQKSSSRFQKMLLLVNTKSCFDSLADLKERKIVTRDDSYQGRLFLEREMSKQLHVDMNEYVHEVMTTGTYSRAVLQAFFGKADACIVPEETFRLVSEMNPAVAKELKVLASSDPLFMPVLAFIRKGVDETILARFKESILDFKKNQEGENVLELLKIKGMYPVSPDELSPLKLYYSDYLLSKKQYGVDDG